MHSSSGVVELDSTKLAKTSLVAGHHAVQKIKL